MTLLRHSLTERNLNDKECNYINNNRVKNPTKAIIAKTDKCQQSTHTSKHGGEVSARNKPIDNNENNQEVIAIAFAIAIEE